MAETAEATTTDGLVPFVFGCLGAAALPGPLLTRVLADLGVIGQAQVQALAQELRRRRDQEATQYIERQRSVG